MSNCRATSLSVSGDRWTMREQLDPKCREARIIFLELLYHSSCYFVMSNCVFSLIPFLMYEGADMARSIQALEATVGRAASLLSIFDVVQCRGSRGVVRRDSPLAEPLLCSSSLTPCRAEAAEASCEAVCASPWSPAPSCFPFAALSQVLPASSRPMPLPYLQCSLAANPTSPLRRFSRPDL